MHKRKLYYSAGIIMGMLHCFSIAQADDTSEVTARIRVLAEKGDAEAQALLGADYMRGQVVPKDEAEGVKWSQKAAAQGNADGEYTLGVAYEHGVGGLPKDETQAVKLWQQAAEKGQKGAEGKLGFVYHDGMGGITKDDTQAVKWWRKAADDGSPIAQDSLGVAYSKGIGGLTKDDAEAVKWYRKAAEKGFPDAQYNLGVHYEKAEGIAQDYVQADLWLSLAAAQGDKHALQDPDKSTIEKAMTPEQLAQAKQLIQQWKPQSPIRQ